MKTNEDFAYFTPTQTTTTNYSKLFIKYCYKNLSWTHHHRRPIVSLKISHY